MYLSKKKKLILAWTIPAAAIVATSVVVPPILITNENNKYQKLIEAENLTPQTFNKMTEEQLNSLFYNPKDFDINFFAYQLTDSILKNDVFAFDQNDFEKVIEKTKSNQINRIYWRNKKTDVIYEIQTVNSDLSTQNEGNYVFNLVINKTFSGSSQTYQIDVEIPTTSFADETTSSKNFIAKKAKEINNLFNEQTIKTILNPENENNDSILNISNITSANNLALLSSSEDYQLTTKKTNSNLSFLIDGTNLKYLNKNIALSFPFSSGSFKLIANAQDAYKFSAKGTFDTNTEIFKFLKQQYSSGNLLYLPELSVNEESGLNDQQKIDKRIQKLIFDPSVNPIYQADEFGNIIPLSSYQAYVVKVSLNGASTYLVSWANVFSLTNSVVDSAPELTLKVNKNNNGELTYQEIMDSRNYGLITTTTNPMNNLVYKVTNVEFASSDQYKTAAIATVEVTHPSLATKKTYKTTIRSGFLSKAYVDLENEIKKLVGEDYGAVNKLVPTVTFREGINLENFINSDLSNLNNVLNSLNISPPKGLTNAKYTPTLARISGDKLFVTFQISSTNDLQKYWQVNGTIQTVTSTTTIDLNTPGSIDS